MANYLKYLDLAKKLIIKSSRFGKAKLSKVLKWAGRKFLCQAFCKVGILFDKYIVSKINPATTKWLGKYLIHFSGQISSACATIWYWALH
jgi:hypothetical protein